MMASGAGFPAAGRRPKETIEVPSIAASAM
jgi:hypothetical protein